MKLLYRGLKYNHDEMSVNVESHNLDGKYRGQTVKCRHVDKTSVEHAHHNLTYRGVHF